MVHDGEWASSPATALSPRIWARIQDHLGLPDHARGDFENMVAGHFEATAARERVKMKWDPQSVEHHFIFMMVDCVERYTGERPNHGEKWFPKLMAVCQLIDREIDPGTVRGALRTPRHGGRDDP